MIGSLQICLHVDTNLNALGIQILNKFVNEKVQRYFNEVNNNVSTWKLWMEGDAELHHIF